MVLNIAGIVTLNIFRRINMTPLDDTSLVHDKLAGKAYDDSKLLSDYIMSRIEIIKHCRG